MKQKALSEDRALLREVWYFSSVGVERFELPISCSQSRLKTLNKWNFTSVSVVKLLVFRIINNVYIIWIVNWIKKNLGWVAFIIWMSGTIIEVVAKYFFDKDLEPLLITSFMVFATLQFVHELLNKEPKTQPWKIYSVLIISILILFYIWV